MKKLILIFLFFTFIPGLRSAENLGIFAKSRMDSVLGQDGVTPAPVTFKNGEKRFLWTFGDTILGEWKGEVSADATLNFNEMTDMTAMPPNSLAISSVPDGENYEDMLFQYYKEKGEVSQFIKYSEDENPFKLRLWADDGIQIKNNLYVYYMVIKPLGGMDFEIIGTGLAKSEIPETPSIEKFNFKRKTDFLLPGIIAGDSVIKKGKYLYILSRTAKDGKRYTWGSIARVKPEHIENPEKYRYLSKKGKWTKENRGKFIGDIRGEASLAWDEKPGKFRIIYMSAEEQKIKAVVFEKFKELSKAGPKTLYSPAPKKGVLYYSAKEIFETENHVYAIYINPSIYQPILVRIEKAELQGVQDTSHKSQDTSHTLGND